MKSRHAFIKTDRKWHRKSQHVDDKVKESNSWTIAVTLNEIWRISVDDSYHLMLRGRESERVCCRRAQLPNLSKEDDSFEFIREREVIVKDSQGEDQCDHTDHYQQYNTPSTTPTAAVPEVKGHSIPTVTFSTEPTCSKAHINVDHCTLSGSPLLPLAH